jgi:2,3-diaminopropionate biosynthesis protein SbnB
MPEFTVIPGPVVDGILQNRGAVLRIVREVYATHRAGITDVPDSYFLRFPDRESDRIIALPCRIHSRARDLAGIKWISSFPENVEDGLPRASAVDILNDMVTGRPFACVEGSRISAARTAASAVLALEALQRSHPSDGRIAFFGTGVIATAIADYLASVAVRVEEVVICDPREVAVRRFEQHLESSGWRTRCGDAAAALACGTVITTTTMGTPHIDTAARPGQVYLNVSLRDFTPDVVLVGQNVVDDVEHVLKANTSVHLAEQQVGNRDFITATIPELLSGDAELIADRGVIVSPFGLGILDLGVAAWIYDTAVERGLGISVPDFFGAATA